MRIQQFVKELKGLSWSRPEEPGKALYHIGAIVARDGGEANAAAHAVAELIKARPLTLPRDKDALDDALTTANAAGESIVVLLEEDLPFEALQQFKKIADFNSFSRYLATDRVPQNTNTRLAVVFAKEAWSKQSHPSFIDLFGVICRLDIEK